jgi:hypothetical protein
LKRRAVEPRREVRARDGNDGIFLKLDFGAQHRDLQRGLAGRVFGKDVGQRERAQVHCTRDRHTVPLIARASGVLHRRKEPGASDDKHYTPSLS